MRILRAAIVASIIALSPVLLKGMVYHGGWMGEIGDDVYCYAGMDLEEPFTPRAISMWLYGPNGEFIDLNWGAQWIHGLNVEARGPKIGPGTYTCHVEYTEDVNGNFEYDSDDFEFVVN